ncbi:MULTISPECIES: RNA polymerase sigma factor [Spirosoma]|uniref:RNA polymerase sigma factor n=1 Tax=Spirosoma liriopis TaxID=2937440 RepID=A0ABT0HHV0_9BACT|nr:MULTISPECIES: RNA polymerase sigma factor [Spirosoma]MCK8491744.1 RNA polymerase sigma factor [Spirosoma liriopis]UHG91101.1 RNA polymerase sigma factor [Spirosoma oryzicola]
MKKARLADEQLVNSFQNTNSPDSFEALYSRYVSKVYHKCLSITKDSEAAQDYTQDIFIKVFNKLDSFQNQSTFSTWLYSIAHNYCLDQLRISKRLTTEPLSDEQANGLPETSSAFVLEERIEELEGVLNQLPKEEVKLLRQKHEQGLSIRALSQQYGISESAVKMRLKRSREKLQKLYAKQLLE